MCESPAEREREAMREGRRCRRRQALDGGQQGGRLAPRACAYCRRGRQPLDPVLHRLGGLLGNRQEQSTLECGQGGRRGGWCMGGHKELIVGHWRHRDPAKRPKKAQKVANTDLTRLGCVWSGCAVSRARAQDGDNCFWSMAGWRRAAAAKGYFVPRLWQSC